MKNKLLEEIKKLNKPHIIIAIDGRCASGKTTLAEALQKELNCNVIHADNFFLRPEQRTEQRLNTAGGNIDYERLEKEVLIPLSREEEFSYRPYDCRTQSLTDPIFVGRHRINIIEGAYSCHPSLQKYYDCKVFMTVDPTEQLRRIEKRNGSEGLTVFKEKWIPLEERYFKECKTEEICDLTLKQYF